MKFSEAKPRLDVSADVLDKMRKFGSEMCPIGPEIKLAIEALKSEDPNTEILKLLESSEFLKLPEKNRFGITFYIILELANRKNKENLLANIELNEKGTAGFDFLNLLFGTNVSIPNKDFSIHHSDPLFISIWEDFTQANPSLKEALEKVLKVHYELAKSWSTLGTEDREELPFRMFRRYTIDPRAFIMRESLAGANTLFLMCSKTIEILNSSSAELKIKAKYNISSDEELKTKKMEIADRTVRYFFRILATKMPEPWTTQMRQRKFELFEDENGELVVSTKDLNSLGSESGLKRAVNFLAGNRYGTKADFIFRPNLKVISGCPAASHPIFSLIPKILFAKAFK